MDFLLMVLRKSFYIHWSAGRSPRVHEVNPGRDPSSRALTCTGTGSVLEGCTVTGLGCTGTVFILHHLYRYRCGVYRYNFSTALPVPVQVQRCTGTGLRNLPINGRFHRFSCTFLP